MSVQIERVELPGIGIRHDLVTSIGRRICVITDRDGERVLGFSDVLDPDMTSDSIALSEEEAAALADVLGATLMVSRLEQVGAGTAGLFTEQVDLPADSPFINQPLGATKARTRTRVSIVAITRGSDVLPSPGPEDVLRAGDTLVAVGTREGLDALGKLISHGPG